MKTKKNQPDLQKGLSTNLFYSSIMRDILYSSCQEKNEEFINTVNSIGWR